MNGILKPTQKDLSEIIEIAEKLRTECKKPLGSPKVEKTELAAIIQLVKEVCQELDAQHSGQDKIINVSDLFAGPFTPTKIEQQLSKFSIRGLIKFRRLLLRPQNLKSKDQSVTRELLNIDSLAKSELEKKIREAVRERWKQNGHPMAVKFCRKLKPWRAYLLSLGYEELAALDIGDIYPQLSVALRECCSKFLITNGKDDSPDSLLNPIIGQLWLVMDNWLAGIQAEDEQKVAGIEYIALDVATRTITIGTKPTPITSERVWNFIKDLVSAAKDDRLVPMLDGGQNNKNNIDQLRRKVGKDNLKKLVILTGDGYKLSPDVKVLNSGQVGIRKTKVKRLRAT
jgi:hypothetical protein